MPFSAFFEEFKRTVLAVFANLFNEMERGALYTYITKILLVKLLTQKKYFEKQSAWKLAYLYVIYYEVSSQNVSGLRYWRSLSFPGCRMSVVKCMRTVDCRVSLMVILVVSWLSGCRLSCALCMLTVDCRVSLLVISVVSWLSDVGCRVHADC